MRTPHDGDVEPAAPAADAVDLDEALRSFQPGFDDLRDTPAERVVGTEPASGTFDETGEVGRDVASPSASSSAETVEDEDPIVEPMLDGEPVEG